MGDEIREKISQLLVREVRDARLSGVHLTRVEMARDLATAKIMWRPTPGEATADDAAEALEKAAGFLRSRIGRTLRLRGVPVLAFELDSLPEEGSHIDGLLSALASARAASERAAALTGADDSEE